MNLKLEHLSKKYETQVLNDLNLEIKDVHALGIIGESGCGKSTLLRILAGIESDHGGKCIINNIEIDAGNCRSYQEQIGYVFQKHNLFPHLTLKQNIVLILNKVKKIPREEAEKHAIDVLSKLHLEEQLDKKPNKVSGGQAQRASIARALSTNPDLLFLDEPTAALDPILTGEVLSSIQELKSLGKDFVFVTHEISFLKDFADYVIFMDRGEIVEHGSILHLSDPETPELKRFIKGEK